MRKPMMSDEEIKVIDDLIEELKPEICLEWGAGNSTIYFPNNHDCIKKWYAVEDSLRWFKYVGSHADRKKVTLCLRDIDNYLDIRGKYDLILIDGEIRNMCLYIARKLLKRNGIILLHDSERNIYHEGVKLYGKYTKVLLRGQKLGNDAKGGLLKLWLN